MFPPLEIRKSNQNGNYKGNKNGNQKWNPYGNWKWNVHGNQKSNLRVELESTWNKKRNPNKNKNGMYCTWKLETESKWNLVI